MLRYYQSYDKLKPHDGCQELCHRLCFVSVLTHTTGYQRLKGIQCVRSTCPSHNYHTKVTISDILIILLKLTIHFFLTCQCARHGVTAYMELRLCLTPPCHICPFQERICISIFFVFNDLRLEVIMFS
jgi:hypothetical protein